MSKTENILAQLRGAAKLFFAVNLVLALFNYSVLINKKHTAFLSLGENCTAIALPEQTAEAVSVMLDSPKE